MICTILLVFLRSCFEIISFRWQCRLQLGCRLPLQWCLVNGRGVNKRDVHGLAERSREPQIRLMWYMLHCLMDASNQQQSWVWCRARPVPTSFLWYDNPLVFDAAHHEFCGRTCTRVLCSDTLRAVNVRSQICRNRARLWSSTRAQDGQLRSNSRTQQQAHRVHHMAVRHIQTLRTVCIPVHKCLCRKHRTATPVRGATSQTRLVKAVTNLVSTLTMVLPVRVPCGSCLKWVNCRWC